jgi:DNA polymerase delta subunit 1
LRDAELPLLLMYKLMCIPNYVEMARVTGVPLLYLLTRGQQIKVLSQIYRRAQVEGYIIPVFNSSQFNNNESYEGATVIEPKTGFYDIPIATLDFNSLYPTIMIAHNLCYTTYLSKDMIKDQELIEKKDYFITPCGHAFLLPSRQQGLLPGILQDLIKARKNAKADLQKETDPFKRAVLDGRQLALKIVANSVYGFTGASKGYLPCPPIASSVTAFGRVMINITQKLIEETYTKEKGYDHEAKVIYGDTDSVMIKFGYMNLEKVMELSREAAIQITKTFKKPINLEFEKIYFPYLLIGKKWYAGLYWTKPHKYDKIDIKGIDIVRRDRCGFIQDIMRRCLNEILINKDVKKAIDIVHQAIRDLLQGNVDLALLTFTGGWGKSNYARDPSHVTVAKKMMQRDKNITIRLGDRIAYVIIAGVNGDKVSSRAEDPTYVRAKNLPIDLKYYQEKMVDPLIDIFSSILGSDKKAMRILFTGEHMNHVVKASITLPSAFAHFTVVKRCRRCKRPMNNGTCESC